MLFRKYVVPALAKFYKLSDSDIDKLEQRYKTYKEKLPDLDLAEVFKALKQSVSPRLVGSSDDRNLYIALANVIAAINLKEKNSKEKGEKLPSYLTKFRDDMQEQVYKLYEDSPAATHCSSVI